MAKSCVKLAMAVKEVISAQTKLNEKRVYSFTIVRKVDSLMLTVGVLWHQHDDDGVEMVPLLEFLNAYRILAFA